MGLIDSVKRAVSFTNSSPSKHVESFQSDNIPDPYDKMLYATVPEQAYKPSSKVSDINYPGFKFVIQPEVPFKTAFRYYLTIGKVQMVVDSYVAEVLSRDRYFEGDATGIKEMDEWSEGFNAKRIIEYMVRNWLICGNDLLGTTDWQPVQMDSLVGIKRDEYGKPMEYVYSVNGKWQPLPLKVDQYIHSKFLEINRQAWGVGMFNSLMTSWEWQGTSAVPMLDLYRNHLQNLAKIENKFASPVVVWAYENLSDEQYKKQKEALQALKPGDRRITTRKPELLTETIDARGGLIGVISPILDAEMEAGLQSAAIRLITDPSAMADAREANKKDDARLLGIMDRVQSVFNTQIIPRITDAKVTFEWGAQDDFDIEMPVGLADAINLKLVGTKEGREILRARGWKLDDALYEAEQKENELKAQQDMELQMQKQTLAKKAVAVEEKKMEAVTLLKKRLEAMNSK